LLFGCPEGGWRKEKRNLLRNAKPELTITRRKEKKMVGFERSKKSLKKDGILKRMGGVRHCVDRF